MDLTQLGGRKDSCWQLVILPAFVFLLAETIRLSGRKTGASRRESNPRHPVCRTDVLPFKPQEPHNIRPRLCPYEGRQKVKFITLNKCFKCSNYSWKMVDGSFKKNHNSIPILTGNTVMRKIPGPEYCFHQHPINSEPCIILNTGRILLIIKRLKKRTVFSYDRS